jgi:hypothetical protein
MADYKVGAGARDQVFRREFMAYPGFDLEATGGLPDAVLFELLNLRSGPERWSNGVTAKGVARIEYELGLKLPWAMVAIAMNVSGYCGMFCGIEGDENNHHHILQANRAARARAVWPKGLVVFSRWGDGIVLCWEPNGEKDAENLPVLWCEWSEKWNDEKEVMEDVFEIGNVYAVNFRRFAEEYAVYHALHHPKRSGRKKAQRILEKLNLPGE